ncbi:MAG: hypothetical protein QGD94_10580, partial [Planctomycetia bacterium]|nr:hypothetical protein [Planctomycetia bacterium]
MAKKIHSYVLALVLFAFAAGGCSPEEPSRQIISETLLADFTAAPRIPDTFSASWDSRHVGYATMVGNKQC